jgi:HEAT repeat protein
LNESDDNLRVKAVWALGEIGDPAAIPALIPLLGDETPVGGWQFSSYTAPALRRLGEGALVNALEAALEGSDTGVDALQEHHCPALTETFRRLLDSLDPLRVAQTAWMCGELGSVELLPLLRQRGRAVRRTAAPLDLRRINEAIERLEAQTKLPRPAMAPSVSVHSLPRPSHEAEE